MNSTKSSNTGSEEGRDARKLEYRACAGNYIRGFEELKAKLRERSKEDGIKE